MAETELKLWKNLYPKYKLCSHKLTLNHQFVLKMPYFTSVLMKKRLNMEESAQKVSIGAIILQRSEMATRWV
jgi:hypothetical protein